MTGTDKSTTHRSERAAWLREQVARAEADIQLLVNVLSVARLCQLPPVDDDHTPREGAK